MKGLVKNMLRGGGRTEQEYALGVMVTDRMLHALLLEQGREGTRVVRRFTRRRGGDYGREDGYGDEGYGDEGYEGSPGSGMPGLEEEPSTGEDFTIQFGEGGGSEHLFLGSEFGDAGGNAKEPFGRPAVSDFAAELSDLLEECHSAGYPDPALAFCLGPANVTQVEVHLPNASTETPPSVEGVGRKALRSALDDQYDGDVEPGRVAFLPMTPVEEGTLRFLALVGQPTDPVVATLRTLQDQHERMPRTGLLETEVSLYFGLARATLRGAGAEKDDALVVRVGSEDTLVLFMEGPVLRHTETLRSLTAQDAPETVCSRVLLLQDEYGLDGAAHVLLASDGQEAELIESVETFFSEAHVEPIRRRLPAGGGFEGERATAGLSAAAASLCLLGGADSDLDFERVDLLPPTLLERRFRLPFSAAVPIMLVLLAGAGIFFGVRYQHLNGQQADLRQRLNAFPERLAETPPNELQARIDSLQAASARYLEGLNTLDQLLMGSDQWSHALAQISRETAAVRGIWVDEWSPQRGAVQLSGNATRRDRIVNLAERVEGQIKSVTFSEIREWPVYAFTMNVPLKAGLPEATKYLREHALTAHEDTSRQGGADQVSVASGQNAGGRAVPSSQDADR